MSRELAMVYKKAEALNTRFPGTDDPFRIVTRLLRECGELAAEVNHAERAGVKTEKNGEPDRARMAKEMLTEKSKQMMPRSFEKARYRFETIPQRAFGSAFGIYVHVPFSKTMCAFCPFCKELYSEERKDRYLDAIENEIRLTEMNGTASSLYIGRGTPGRSVAGRAAPHTDAIRAKSTPPSIGIELHPSLFDTGYLEGLAETGFTKVSMGIKSLQDSVLAGNGRKPAAPAHIDSLLRTCRSRGLESPFSLLVASLTFRPGRHRYKTC